MDDRRKYQDTFTLLSDDLVMNCLARVSRFYYPALASVSRRFRSLVASPELYQARSFLGLTEKCLYVCLRTGDPNQLRWFALWLRPNSSKKCLVPVPSPNPISACVFAVVGSDIYAFGGGEDNALFSTMVMDTFSHTWRDAPSMRVAREVPSACVFDGKIYVTGGYKNLNSTNWTEIFDTKTQTWEFLQKPSELCRGIKYQSFSYGGTVYLRSDHATYKLHRGRWREAGLNVNSSITCVIEDVLYSCRGGKICWYDPRDRRWKLLDGLEGLSQLKKDVKLVDHGGKMAVLWEEYNLALQSMIWCAEIELQRCQNGEIRGTVEWCENLFASNRPNDECLLIHALSVTVW